MSIIACPVALHPDGTTQRVAVYQTTQGSKHLVKTTTASSNEATRAAAQTLYSMSALETRAALPIGTSADINPDDVWHFALCRIVPPIREQWKHICPDTSALLQFSWMPLGATFEEFSGADTRALNWVKANL